MKIVGNHFRPLILLAIAFFALTIPSTALAVPSELSLRQSEAKRIIAEIEEIDMRLEPVIDEYNKASEDLSEVRARITDAEQQLTEAKKRLAARRTALNKRLAGIYRNGRVGVVEVVFGARNFDDFVRRFDMLKRIGKSDTELVREVIRTKHEVEQRQAALKEHEKAAAARLNDVAGTKSRIEAALAERNRMLASVRAEIENIKKAEAEKEAREAEALRRRVEAQRAAEAARARSQAPIASRGGSGRSDVVSIAMRYLGIPYVYGGSDPSTGFDCSGLTMYVYRQVGISLPHYAAAQYAMGVHVSRFELEPGDLVFFNSLGHVGIYVGGGQYIHAPRTGEVVRIDNLGNRSDYVGAVRL